MGAFIDSLSVRSGDAEGIKTRIVRWLSAKGFEPRPEAPLFGLTMWDRLLSPDAGGGDERGLFLLSNQDWTVLLYSHMTEEGERLLFELGRDATPVLKTWVHDSDLWGYQLHKEGELLAAFNSNPRYFGAEEPAPLPDNGNPRLVCEVCGLGALEAQLAAVQRGRAVFAEGICQRFCVLVGAAPAGFDYRDLHEHGLDLGGPHEIGGYRVEHLYFARRGLRPDEPPDLHRLPIRSPRTAEDAAPAEPFTIPLEWRLVQWFFRIVFFLLRPFLYLLRLFFRFWFWWRGKSPLESFFGRGARQAFDPFSEALLRAERAEVQVEGRSVINRRQRCRITLPEGVTSTPAGGRWVFLLTLEGHMAHCEAVRPGDIEDRLRLYPGWIMAEDANFFVGALPARRVVRQSVGQAQVQTQHGFIVQTPRAFYCFWLTGFGEVPPEAVAKLREVVESFTLLGA